MHQQQQQQQQRTTLLLLAPCHPGSQTSTTLAGGGQECHSGQSRWSESSTVGLVFSRSPASLVQTRGRKKFRIMAPARTRTGDKHHESSSTPQQPVNYNSSLKLGAAEKIVETVLQRNEIHTTIRTRGKDSMTISHSRFPKKL